MSMSLDVRPIRRSRTHPPTTSARPPASLMAPMIEAARSGTRNGPAASVLSYKSIGVARRDGVENRKSLRRAMRIYLGPRVTHALDDGGGHVLDRLRRPEAGYRM